MSKMLKSISLYTLALTLPFAVVAQTSIADIQKTSDASGDSPKDGETVTISGIVTAEFWGSYNKRTFFVQDADSAWSGIMVYNHDGWDTFSITAEDGSTTNSLARGDSVSVTGTVDEYYGKTQIVDVTAVTIHSSGHEVEPIDVLASVINTGSATAEQYEGVLVRIVDVAVDSADLGYGEWSVADSSGIVRVDDVMAYYYTPIIGHNLAEVVGVLDYSYDNFKILPRLANDVVEFDMTRIQRVQQVLYSDLIETGDDEESDISYMTGDTLSIEGIVTMPTGLSYAGAGVKFIYQDVNGGPWSSILSYDPDSTAFPVLYEGDHIRATGYIAEYSTGPANMTELFVTEPIEILDTGLDTPPVEVVNTGDLRWPTEAEQWGTVMVRVKNATVTANDLAYGEWAVDDGSGSVKIDDDSGEIADWQEENGRPPVGTLVDSIQGWVYHHYGSYGDSTSYKLEPLYPDDIVISGGPPVIKDYSRSPCVPKPDSSVTLTVTISDNSTIASAEIYYAVDAGSYQSVTMTNTSGTTYAGTIPATSTDGARVHYYVKATDDGDGQNSAMSATLPSDTEVQQYSYITKTGNLTIYDLQYTKWSGGDSPFDGCEVTVNGIVTADTSQNNAGYGGYAMQATSAPWNGIVFNYDDTEVLTRGDSISVTGTVEEYNPSWHFKYDNNTMIEATKVTKISSGHTITSLLVKSADLSQDADEVESYEGVVVTVEDPMVVSINQYDWSIWDETEGLCLMDDDMATPAGDAELEALEQFQQVDYVAGVFNFSFGTYKIQVRDEADLGVVTAGVEQDITPYTYRLYQNFPNPFNPSTRIRFEIAERQQVDVVIYDIRGFKVRTLSKETLNAGFHVMNWDGTDDHGQLVSSGVYMYRVKAGEFIDHKKMTLVR
ncbi:MAG: hypothetical protein CMG71_03330 [Candidatus Marinimicrobia bacterium]|nr:hypothetical protein [Candidatus Neomarinimicrobiota bacterium]